MSLGRTRCDLSVVSDLKTVRMPCCCRQRRRAYDNPLNVFLVPYGKVGRDFIDVSEKVSNWVHEVATLSEFALSQPQACYAAYTFGLKHRWTYFSRTLPDIQDLLEPLENAISRVLIPAITERKCNQLDRTILALPARLGGLGFGNPCLEASREYASSVKVTTPLVEQIVSQLHEQSQSNNTPR